MQKRRAISLLLCLALLLGFACPVFAEETTVPEMTAPESAEPQVNFLNTDASVTNGCRTLDAQVPMLSDKVLETGTAGILYEVTSDTLMYGQNMDLVVDPGSFVKLMTAILAVELGDINQEITVTQQMLDLVPSDSLTQGFLADEVLTLEQLLYSLILTSANDAAVIIAVHIAGSQEAFVELMNQKAAQIGCTDTNYRNVHGIHDDQQYTSVRDLTKIMVYGLQYDMFKTLISTAQYYIAETNLSESRRLDTNNYMLSRIILEEYYDSRVTGGRVSTNANRERSLIVTAEIDGLSYIGIVMDTKPVFNTDGYGIIQYNEFVEMDDILDLVDEGYVIKQIFYEGQICNSFAVTGGENSVAAGPARSIKSVLSEDAGIDALTMRLLKNSPALDAPVEKGQTLDILQVWLGSVCIAQTELIAMNASAAAAVSLTDASNSEAGNSEGIIKVLAVLGIILILVIAFVLILYAVRAVRRVLFQAKRRRRRASRRRSR